MTSILIIPAFNFIWSKIAHFLMRAHSVKKINVFRNGFLQLFKRMIITKKINLQQGI